MAVSEAGRVDSAINLLIGEVSTVPGCRWARTGSHIHTSVFMFVRTTGRWYESG